MTKMPSYIPLKKIAVSPQHEWNDWNPYEPIVDADESTENALRILSDRARLSFGIACAEWVVFRFDGLLDDNRPLQFIEAFWACQMSEDFAIPPESEESEWKGNVRGAIDLALMTLLNIRYAEEDGDSHMHAAYVEAIANHVLVDNLDFMNWRNKILPRLEKLFPRNNSEPLGEPVPREILDPAFPVEVESFSSLVQNFLDTLDKEGNPYIQRVL